MEILEIGISDLGIPKILFTTFARPDPARARQIQSSDRGRWQIKVEEKCEQGEDTVAIHGELPPPEDAQIPVHSIARGSGGLYRRLHGRVGMATGVKPRIGNLWDAPTPTDMRKWLVSLSSRRNTDEWKQVAGIMSSALHKRVVEHKDTGYRGPPSKRKGPKQTVIWPAAERVVQRLCDHVMGVCRTVRRVSTSDLQKGYRPYLSLCGPSGSGKTTLLQSIAKTLGVHYVHVLGRDLPSDAARLGRLLFTGDPKIIEITAAYAMENTNPVRRFIDAVESGGRCSRWPVIFSSSASPTAVYRGHLFSVFAGKYAIKVAMPRYPPVKFTLSLAIRIISKETTKRILGKVLKLCEHTADPMNECGLRDFTHRVKMLALPLCEENNTSPAKASVCETVNENGSFVSGKISWIDFVRNIFVSNAHGVPDDVSIRRAEAVVQDGGNVLQGGAAAAFSTLIDMHRRTNIGTFAEAIASYSDFDVLFQGMDGFRTVNAHPTPGASDVLSWFVTRQAKCIIQAYNGEKSAYASAVDSGVLSRRIRDGKRIVYNSFSDECVERPLSFFKSCGSEKKKSSVPKMTDSDAAVLRTFM